MVAYGAYRAIAELTRRKPVCFAVKSLADNPIEIEGVPVREVEGLPRDIFVVVGVTELVQKEALPELDKSGFYNRFVLTQHEEHLLMSAYYQRIGRFTNHFSRFAMYEVRNHRDKRLGNPPELHYWEVPIQAGAALTDQNIADVRDDSGENISSKNKQYCEMSAVYWVWKNAKHDWVGIEHYRRHLLVKPEMLTDDTDVFLPLPYMCFPDEKAQFRRFVGKEVLEALECVLERLHPAEYRDYMGILSGPFQYTYNLLCTRWEVFDDYCSWFFQIAEHMEKTGITEIVETRALSYVAEVLTNLYFMSRKEKLSIRHVEKAIYV
ncbi:MAG: DUF4422 domain-containing protein [Lachnospiraceae bacterium]|nr:DUF4422 domain-containing protein [Lachnospiraceae bacterium]